VHSPIGLYILNLGYGFEGTGTRLRDFHFVSDMFTGRESQEPEENSPPSRGGARGGSLTNRFTTSWWGVLPVPLPKNYVLGIDIQQKDFKHYDRPSYLRGEWRDHGWWYYYLYAALIKVPLDLWFFGIFTLLLPLLSAAISVSPAPQIHSFHPPFRDTLVLLTPLVVILCVASSKTGFSEHFRYVLPCFPFLFIWLSQIARSLQARRTIPR
jgi:hypothetical protein